MELGRFGLDHLLQNLLLRTHRGVNLTFQVASAVRKERERWGGKESME